MVAMSPLVKVGNPLIFKAKDLSGLAARPYVELEFTMESGHFYLSTEGSLSKIDG